MQEITFQRALETVRDVVKERPHHVDTSSDMNGCLVGVVIQRMGVPVLNSRGGVPCNCGCGLVFNESTFTTHNSMAAAGVIKMDEMTTYFFGWLMHFNDTRFQWASALTASLKMMQSKFGVEAIKAADPKPEPEEKPEDKVTLSQEESKKLFTLITQVELAEQGNKAAMTVKVKYNLEVTDQHKVLIPTG